MAAAAPKLISREVFVHIIVDPNGPTPIRVDPDRFWVSKGMNEEVVWHCTSTDPNDPNPDFTVVFNQSNGSPFNESQFSRDYLCSGLVKRGVQPSNPNTGPFYKYTVTVGGASVDPDGGVKP